MCQMYLIHLDFYTAQCITGDLFVECSMTNMRIMCIYTSVIKKSTIAGGRDDKDGAALALPGLGRARRLDGRLRGLVEGGLRAHGRERVAHRLQVRHPRRHEVRVPLRPHPRARASASGTRSQVASVGWEGGPVASAAGQCPDAAKLPKQVLCRVSDTLLGSVLGLVGLPKAGCTVFLYKPRDPEHAPAPAPSAARGQAAARTPNARQGGVSTARRPPGSAHGGDVRAPAPTSWRPPAPAQCPPSCAAGRRPPAAPTCSAAR